MFVDIIVKNEPSHRVASIQFIGSFSGENHLRKEFNELVAWAKAMKVRTGKWIFVEVDGFEAGKQRRWEACIEIKDAAKSDGRVMVKNLPLQKVASVKFDPEEVSSRLVYHGIEGWLHWRERFHELKSSGPSKREIYSANPWTNARAWKRAEVQFPVEKME